MQTEVSPDGHSILLYPRVHDIKSEGAASTTSEKESAVQTVGTAERSLFGARKVLVHVLPRAACPALVGASAPASPPVVLTR
jgi:hypothetical protein